MFHFLRFDWNPQKINVTDKGEDGVNTSGMICVASFWDLVTCTSRVDHRRRAGGVEPRQVRDPSFCSDKMLWLRWRCYPGAAETGSPGTTPSHEFELLLTGKTMWPQAPAPYHPPSESLILLARCVHWIGKINGCPPHFCFRFLQWKTMTCHCDIDWRESRPQLFYYQVFAACPSLSRCCHLSFTCLARRQAARRLASNLFRKQCGPSAPHRRHHNQPKSNMNRVFMTAISVIKGSASVTSKMLMKPIRYMHIQILGFYAIIPHDYYCNQISYLYL